jgi:hypothetical protein
VFSLGTFDFATTLIDFYRQDIAPSNVNYVLNGLVGEVLPRGQDGQAVIRVELVLSPDGSTDSPWKHTLGTSTLMASALAHLFPQRISSRSPDYVIGPKPFYPRDRDFQRDGGRGSRVLLAGSPKNCKLSAPLAQLHHHKPSLSAQMQEHAPALRLRMFFVFGPNPLQSFQFCCLFYTAAFGFIAYLSYPVYSRPFWSCIDLVDLLTILFFLKPLGLICSRSNCMSLLADILFVGEGIGSLEDVGEFADVAWPRMVLEFVHGAAW